MGLCSVLAMLDKIAVHGTNNLIFSGFEEQENVKLMSEEVL